jgi:hypothetical protein
MSEKPPRFEAKKELTDQEKEWKELEESYADKINAYVSAEAGQDSPEHCAEKIEELNTLLDSFEKTHDVEALYAITELDRHVAKDHPTREPARQDLAPIVALLNYLEKQKAVSPEVFATLKARHRYLDQAIGTIRNENQVIHLK